MYLPDTNVLMTRFFTDEGMAEVTDFMPIGKEAGGHTEQSARQIVRIAKAMRGPVRFRMECRPAFDYAPPAAHASISEATAASAIFASPLQQFVLKGPLPMQREGDGDGRRSSS